MKVEARRSSKAEAASIRIIMKACGAEVEAAPRKTRSLTNIEQRKASNINVFVRVRPLSKDELSAGLKSVIDISEDEKIIQVGEYFPKNTKVHHLIFVFHLQLENCAQTCIQVLDRQPSYGYSGVKAFQFDGCFGPSVTQEKIMEKCKMQKLLDSVLDGYSSTIMAYGQTGSGKTYTMCGRQEANVKEKLGDTGVIARSVRYIFDAVKQRFAENKCKSYAFRASYFEIYNEQVNDLLRVDTSPREVKWNPEGGFHVDGLLLVDCEVVDDVFAVLNEGAKNRKVGSHNQNKDSSRSHCIMTLYVDSISSLADGPSVVRHGRLLFVDLAGSERLKKSRSSGEMLKETGSINRSLFTLGKVISALSEGKKEDIVPYRESMLTKLIMESLGGSSLGLMIACISPASTAVDQTLSTLHYATCAKQIINIPSVKMDDKDRVIIQLQKEVCRLRDENKLLRSRLALPGEGEVPESCRPTMCMRPPGGDDSQDEFQPPEVQNCENGCELEHSFFDEPSGSEYWQVAESLQSRSQSSDVTYDSREGTTKGDTVARRVGKSCLHRRQRICVDHLSSGVKTKVAPRTSSRCGMHEGFQGSIIVNQDAFLRILNAAPRYEQQIVDAFSMAQDLDVRLVRNRSNSNWDELETGNVKEAFLQGGNLDTE